MEKFIAVCFASETLFTKLALKTNQFARGNAVGVFPCGHGRINFLIQ